jgi:hypothetical protein
MDTSELARRLRDELAWLPDAGLGPVTARTRAGRPNAFLDTVQEQQRPQDYMAPVAETLSIPLGAYGAGQLVGSGINAAREGDYGSGAGQIALGMAGMLPMAPKGGKGIRAFHGSPHDFDRFNMEHIGKGEGAQAYGHGLYFADAEDVARSYRDTLSKSGQDWGQRALDKAGGDVDAAISTIQSKVDKYRAGGADNLASSQEEILRALHQYKETGSFSQGHMYEVNINADPADFLDWDKPLSEQPQVARKLGFSTMTEDAIHDEALRLMDEGNKAAGRQGGWVDDPAIKARIDELQNELDKKAPTVTGANFYRGSTDDDFLHSLLTSGNSLQGRSQELSKAGIPGIRYLDQGSRAAGEGSSNYVVFDDALIEIMRKYGLLGPVAAGAGILGSDDGNTY